MNCDLTPIIESVRSLKSEPDAFVRQIAYVRDAGWLLPAFLTEVTTAFPDKVPDLFPILTALGRADLSVGRVYEGHVNAVQLIARLGTPDQVGKMHKLGAKGGLLGVWGADEPTNPGRIAQHGTSYVLSGTKTYASGSDLLDCALVVVKNESGDNCLVLLDKAQLAERFDPSWWKPVGMKATRSCAVDLSGIEITHDQLLGAPKAYMTQPFFGAGAIRFVTVQLGGLLAVWDATVDHLRTAGRYENPHQAVRLALMMADLEAIYSGVEKAYVRVAPGIGWSAGEGLESDALIADSARIALEACAQRVMALAIQSVGCGGLMETHPLAGAMSDLMVYLRQPAPDAALMRLGVPSGSGVYKAAFDAC